jgi:hypothetical protein
MKPKTVHPQGYSIKKPRSAESAPMGNAKSDAFEAIHSAASALYRAGIIDERTMREFDAVCLKASDQREGGK